MQKSQLLSFHTDINDVTNEYEEDLRSRSNDKKGVIAYAIITTYANGDIDVSHTGRFGAMMGMLEYSKFKIIEKEVKENSL